MFLQIQQQRIHDRSACLNSALLVARNQEVPTFKVFYNTLLNVIIIVHHTNNMLHTVHSTYCCLNVTMFKYVSTSVAQAYVVTTVQNPNPKLTIQSSLTNTSTYNTSQTRYC